MKHWHWRLSETLRAWQDDLDRVFGRCDFWEVLAVAALVLFLLFIVGV